MRLIVFLVEKVLIVKLGSDLNNLFPEKQGSGVIFCVLVNKTQGLFIKKDVLELKKNVLRFRTPNLFKPKMSRKLRSCLITLG